MNIGIRLHDTRGNGLAEHLEAAHAQGFTCVQLAMQKVIPGFAMLDAPTLLTDDLAQETRTLLTKNKLQCAVLGCYLELGTPDEEKYARTLACYQAHLRFAPKIGALVVGTETSRPLGGSWTEESLQLFIRRLEPVVRCAEEVGAIIAIEPVFRHNVNTPECAQRVLEALPSDSLHIILDAVNLLTPQNHLQATSLVEESIRRFGDRIRVLHMKDYELEEGNDGVRSIACGTGSMDYAALLRFAKAHEGMPMTLENTTPDNAVAARLYLEEKGKELAK